MDDGLPVADPPATVPADAARADAIVAGVLLAAGTSSRFGEENKLLAPLGGDPLVTHAARTLAAAPLNRLLAVVGHEADAVRAAVERVGGFDVVENPAHEDGQATTVATAVEALAGVDAAVFALGDMPRFDPGTVAALVDAYRAGVGTALAAAHDGRRGNPVLFDATHFPALAGVEGDVGGRAVLLTADDAALVETGDPGVHVDVDTPGDLAALRDG
jgi:molybdenum cofactor cytidylyltransferase